MNRQQRRAEAAQVRAAAVRHSAVRDAVAYMVARNDRTISGATLFLPTGETLYLPAEVAQDTRQDREGVH